MILPRRRNIDRVEGRYRPALPYGDSSLMKYNYHFNDIKIDFLVSTNHANYMFITISLCYEIIVVPEKMRTVN